MSMLLGKPPVSGPPGAPPQITISVEPPKPIGRLLFALLYRLAAGCIAFVSASVPAALIGLFNGWQFTRGVLVLEFGIIVSVIVIAEALLSGVYAYHTDAQIAKAHRLIAERMILAVGEAPSAYEVQRDVTAALATLQSPSFRILKQALDQTVAISFVILMGPVLLLIAALIKVETSGPILFKKSQVGPSGKSFTRLLFRTEHVGPSQHNWWPVSYEPNLTRVGRFLRVTSLDHLPQLFLVVRGEWSIVGHHPNYDSKLILPLTSRLKPGIIGPWVFKRDLILRPDVLEEMSIDYLSDWSIWRDVRMMIGTIPLVTFSRPRKTANID